MKYPTQCYIELTQNCNLKCKHCFAQCDDTKKQELTLDEIEKIYSQIDDLGIHWVNISGGEPLLHEKFFEIMEIASDKPFVTCLLTNAILWNESIIKKLSEIDINRSIGIQISFDGYDAKTTSLQRPVTEEEYNKIIENCGLFKKYGFKIYGLHVASALTIPNTIKTIKMGLNKLKFDSFQVIPFFPTGRGKAFIGDLDGFWDAWIDLVVTLTNVKKNKEWNGREKCMSIGFFTLYELAFPLDKMGMHSDIKNVWGLDIDDVNNFRKQTLRDHFCEAGNSELVISSNRDVFPCVAAVRTDQIAGNIDDKTLNEVWHHSENLDFFREIPKKVIEREPCCNCDYKLICGGGCRLTAIEILNDISAPDPRCPIVIEWKNNKSPQKNIVSFA